MTEEVVDFLKNTSRRILVFLRDEKRDLSKNHQPR